MNRHGRRTAAAMEPRAERRKSGGSELCETMDPEVVRSAIAREMQGWGGGLLMFGVLQLVPGTNLDHLWGVVLLFAAGMAFYFNSAALLPFYGVILGWAMVTNLFCDEWWWMGLGLFQAYLVFRTFRQFVVLQRASSRVGIGLEAESLHRADVVFPWTGCGFAAAAWIILAIMFVAGVISSMNGQEPSEQAIGTAITVLVDLACLGLGLALAALLARYRFRVVSILAVLGASLMLGGFVALIVLK